MRLFASTTLRVMFHKVVIAGALLLLCGRVALAQPAADEKLKGDNPPNTQTPFQDPKEREKLMNDMQAIMNMTPEQRKEYMRKMNQGILRSSLTRAGFKEQKLQDDILLFVDEQEKSREGVRQAATKVYLALEPRGVPTDAQGMEALLNDYQAATEEAKAERETATKAFETKMGLSNKPHLRAFLLFNGIIGDAGWYTADIIMGSTMGIAAIANNLGAPPAKHPPQVP